MQFATFFSASCGAEGQLNMLMISSSDSENRVQELEGKNQWLTRQLKVPLGSHWFLASSSATRFSLSDEEIMSMLTAQSAA